MGTLPSAVTLRERIGGRWAITWVTYVVLLVATPIATVAYDGLADPGAFAAVVASSAAAACAVLLVADVTVMRNRRVKPVAPTLVVGVSVLAGLVRAGTGITVASSLGMQVPRGNGVIIVGSVCLAVVTVVGIALLRDAIDRHRRERAALVARLAALREISGERTELAQAINDAAYAEMMSVLDDARRGMEVPVGEMSVDDRLALAHDLRRTVNEQLRPISHRLYADSRRPEPTQATGIRAMVASLRRHPIFPFASALVVLGVSSAFAEYAIGPLLVAGLVWGSLAAVAAAARRVPGVRRHQMLLGLVVASVLGAAAVSLLRVSDGESNVVGVSITALLMVATMIVFTSLVGALVTNDGANAQLAQEVDARELEAMLVSRELARTSRDLAQYVHGTLQANLLATALALEQAAESGDERAFARALADARASLASQPEDASDTDPDLPAALTRVADLWRGFLGVRIDVAADLRGPMPPALVSDVSRIVGEAVANARKHGAARDVRVTVRRAPDGEHLHVTVADDGSGPAGGVKGMGAAWLDFIAPGAWTLTPCPDGTGACLDVHLPMPGATARVGAR